ncbi:hypothetical protein C8R44DRAFT_985554 [Mycena epipterygia]|nr:hypothetical protein C8R44DRAFT_985554 [Mycena epipterygia]
MPATRDTLPIIDPVRLVHTEYPLKGDRPFFNDWPSMVVDHQREKVYSYGGVRPGDESNTNTSDFHCLDLKTMTWSNLTDGLRFRPSTYVSDPFLKDPPNVTLRRLPALMEPAIALMSNSGPPPTEEDEDCLRGTFLFLFGGHNSDNPTSDLIAIDLDLNTWWVVDVQGTPILPRMSTSMVAIRNKLFIFGGRTRFANNAPTMCTYSVAKLHRETPWTTRWTWEVSDAQMPPNLPALGCSIQATPVHDSQMILLARGRVRNDERINLSSETTIFFHTRDYTFRNAGTTIGTFPRELAWYQLYSVVAERRPREPEAASSRPPKRRRIVPTDDLCESVVIFGWVSHRHGLIPDAWQYFPQEGRIRCLNLRDKVCDLYLDLQAFVPVGNRLLLLGNVPIEEERCGGLLRFTIETDRAQWDVAIEISSTYLTE